VFLPTLASVRYVSQNGDVGKFGCNAEAENSSWKKPHPFNKCVELYSSDGEGEIRIACFVFQELSTHDAVNVHDAVGGWKQSKDSDLRERMVKRLMMMCCIHNDLQRLSQETGLPEKLCALDTERRQ
jgi:hypothetical protein